MTNLTQFCLVVVSQVSVVCIAASILMAVWRSHSSRRHGIAVVALGLLLVSPLLGVCLPAGWVSATATISGPENDARDELRNPNAELLSAAPANTFQSVPNDSPHTNPDLEFSARASFDKADSGDTTNETVAVASANLNVTDDSASSWPYVAAVLGVWVWLTGIVLASLRLLWRRHQLKPIRRSFKRLQNDAISAGIQSHIKEQLAPARLPEIVTSDILPTPAVLGVFRPVVVLPEELVAESNSQQLTDVLVHECAHVVRQDHWVHALQQFAGVLYWFHPGVMWLNHALSKAREEVCDNYVLRQSNAADYAQTLLQLTERCSDRRPALSLLGLFRPRWSLESRITDLLNPQRTTKVRPERPLLIIIAMVLFLSCLLTGGVADESADFQNDVKQSAAAQPANNKGVPDVAPSVDADAQGNIVTESNSELRTIRLRGVCENDAEEPIADATVKVFRYPSRTAEPIKVAEGRTNADGRFEFLNVQSQVDFCQYPAGLQDLVLTATCAGHASAYVWPQTKTNHEKIKLRLSSKIGTLSGRVTDDHGRPVSGATVTRLMTSAFFTHPNVGVQSSVTNAKGDYAIVDLPRWIPQGIKIDPETGRGFGNMRCAFYVIHPNFALNRPMYSAISQKVDIRLNTPASIVGRVIDAVTNQPLPDVVVTAGGIARNGEFRTRTDQNGRYQLKVNRDHYNLWATFEYRMPVAVKAVKAESGKTIAASDIKMVRGGFVVGRVLDANGQPLHKLRGQEIHVGHYGPARPRSTSEITSATVRKDGTFRLHVAPGRNYVYLANEGGDDFEWITIADGEEITRDFVVGAKSNELEGF